MSADTAGTFRNKRCPPLADLVAAYDLTDGFYSLHPNVQSFTFFRRNTPGSRLDRAYIPPQLLPHLLAVTHPPSLSDHSALYVRLAGVLQTAQPPPIPTSYWKFNTSLVKEEDFLPSFSAMWAALVAAQARGACPATWWENTAKPACRAFCISFSKMVAHRHRELASLLLAGLQVALLANDWPVVAALKSRLHQLAAYRLAGRAVRAGLARGPEAAATFFQTAAEVAKPPSDHFTSQQSAESSLNRLRWRKRSSATSRHSFRAATSPQLHGQSPTTPASLLTPTLAISQNFAGHQGHGQGPVQVHGPPHHPR